MPIKQLSSAAFDADALAREFIALGKAMPRDAVTKRNDVPPVGAFVFYGPDNMRLIVQYEIQTDTHSARFDVLIETPDGE